MSSAASANFQHAANCVVTGFWATVYFVYFLFKGKREWKCDKSELEKPKVTYCCVNDSSSSSLKYRGPPEHKPEHHHDGHNSSPKSFYTSNSGISGFLKSTWQKAKQLGRGVWDRVRCVSRKAWHWAKKIGAQVWNFASWLFGLIYVFLFPVKLPSQTLPATPKPYISQPSTPTYNKVEFKYDEKLPDEKSLQEEIQKQIGEDQKAAEVVPPSSESFYYERVFEEPPKDPKDQKDQREKSVPPPPPPPPPPKPVSREPSRARSMTPGAAIRATTPGRKEVKGGIGGFNADILDELEEQHRLRHDRASVQREMTQSCHPDMAQWKADASASGPAAYVDRASANSTPWRASSVGPTMRKLEHVVSRIDGGQDADGGANFVFRPKLVHSSADYVAQNQYLMGRSVFSPVDEAEKMRQNINSNPTAAGAGAHQPSYSSPQYQNGNWMESQRSRSVNQRGYDQNGHDQSTRNIFGSSAYKNSPYSSHTARRSKTPVRFNSDLGEVGGVDSIARQWPPPSNAAAAASNARDDWVDRSMRGGGGAGGEEDDNGLVMTMCRRVVERKREDNWKWKDENGRLLDEKNHNTWKGELDTLLRDGPNEGRHWSRTVEKLPTGDTRFQDVNRQYNKEFVVESVVRNY